MSNGYHEVMSRYAPRRSAEFFLDCSQNLISDRYTVTPHYYVVGRSPKGSSTSQIMVWGRKICVQDTLNIAIADRSRRKWDCQGRLPWWCWEPSPVSDAPEMTAARRRYCRMVADCVLRDDFWHRYAAYESQISFYIGDCGSRVSFHTYELIVENKYNFFLSI